MDISVGHLNIGMNHHSLVIDLIKGGVACNDKAHGQQVGRKCGFRKSSEGKIPRMHPQVYYMVPAELACKFRIIKNIIQ